MRPGMATTGAGLRPAPLPWLPCELRATGRESFAASGVVACCGRPSTSARWQPRDVGPLSATRPSEPPVLPSHGSSGAHVRRTDRSSCVVKGRWCGGRTRQSEATRFRGQAPGRSRSLRSVSGWAGPTSRSWDSPWASTGSLGSGLARGAFRWVGQGACRPRGRRSALSERMISPVDLPSARRRSTYARVGGWLDMRESTIR